MAAIDNVRATAVLQGIERQICQLRCVFMAVYTDYSAIFLHGYFLLFV